MRLDDPLPVKFSRETKRWLMQRAKARPGTTHLDRSISAVVREIVEEKRVQEKRALDAAKPTGLGV